MNTDQAGGSGGSVKIGGTSVPPAYVGWVNMAAAQYHIRPELLASVLQTESGFNPTAHSSAGAIGIAQFEPGTARQYGVNSLDPQSSIFGAAHMLSDLEKQFGSESAALVGYNAGPGASHPGATSAYAREILARAGGQSTVDPAAGSSGAAGGDSFSNLGHLLSNLTSGVFWARIGRGAAGVLVVAIGVWFLMSKDTKGNIKKAVTAVAI